MKRCVGGGAHGIGIDRLSDIVMKSAARDNHYLFEQTLFYEMRGT